MLKKTETIKNKSNKEIKITAQRNDYAQLLMLAQENNINLEKLFASMGVKSIGRKFHKIGKSSRNGTYLKNFLVKSSILRFKII